MWLWVLRDVTYSPFDVQKDDSYTVRGRVVAQGVRHCKRVAIEQKFNVDYLRKISTDGG